MALMKEAFLIWEVSPRNPAYPTDRVLTRDGHGLLHSVAIETNGPRRIERRRGRDIVRAEGDAAERHDRAPRGGLRRS